MQIGNMTREELISEVLELRKMIERFEHKEITGLDSTSDNAENREGLFSMLFDSAGVGLLVLDSFGNISQINPKALDIIGLEREDIFGKNIEDLSKMFHMKIDSLIPQFKETIESTNGEVNEWKITNGKGRRLTVSAEPTLLEKKGEHSGVLVELRDITDKKESEKALEESEEKYRDLVENINDIIYSVDAKGIVKYVSPSVRQMLGFDHSEMIGRQFSEFVYEEDLPIASKNFQKVMEGEIRPWEYRIKTRSGWYCWAQISSKPTFLDGKLAGIKGVLTNIHEKKEVEKALKRSEEKYRNLIENINEVVYRLDPEGKVTYLSPSVEAFLGYSQEEVINRPFLDFIHKEDHQRIIQNFKSTMAGKIESNEYRAVSKSGEVKWLQTSSRPMVKDGRIEATYGVMIDITDRKKADEVLRESEEKWHSLIKNAPDVILYLDLEGNILYFNRITTGNREEEVIGSPVYNFIPQEQHHKTKEAIEEVIRTCSPVEFETEVMNNDGTSSWFLTRLGPINHREKIVGIAQISTDITERKKMDDALKESEEKYRKIIEQSSEGFVLIDEKGVVVEWNPSEEKITGLKKEDVIGKKIWDVHYLMEPDEHRTKEKLDEVQTLVTEGYQQDSADWMNDFFERRIKHIDGSLRTVDCLVFPISTSKGKYFGSINHDITERRNVEKAIQRSEERFRELADLLPQTVYELNLEGGLTYSNQYGFDNTGYSQEDIDKGLNAVQLFVPEDRERIKKNMGKVLRNEMVTDNEYTALRKDGSTYPVITFSRPIVRDGKTFGIRGIVVDITKIKKAELAYKESEEKLRLITDNTSDFITITDTTGRFIFVSPSQKSLGYDPEDLIGTNGVAFIHPDDIPNIIENLNDLYDVQEIKDIKKIKNIKNGQGNDPDNDKRTKGSKGANKKNIDSPLRIIGYRVKDKWGNYHYIEDTVNPIYDNDGNLDLVVHVSKDLTERKQAEEEIHNFFDLSSDILAIIDIDSNQLKKINPAFTKKTGYLADDIYSRSLVDFIHKKDLDKLMMEFETKIASGKTHTIYSETRLLCKNGDYIWVGLNANRVPSEGMVYVVARDITDHKMKELEIKKRLMKYKLEEGNIYLIMERVPKESVEAFNDLVNVGYEGDVFSRRSQKDLKFGITGNFNYHWLAESKNYYSVRPDVMAIKGVLEDLPVKGAILFDRLDYLVFRNGIKNTISFVQDLKEMVYLKDSIAVLSIDPNTIKNEELKLLEKDCLELEPLHKTMLSQDLFEILKYIMEKNSKKINPSYNTIIDDLKMSRPTARKRLTRLMNLGYIIETKKGREKIFELTEKSLNILG